MPRLTGIGLSVILICLNLTGCSLPRQEKTMATPTAPMETIVTPNLELTVQAAV